MAGRVTQFLKQTSIKGIPRIFRTKSYFLRTLWGVSVVCFLTMAAYQTFLLARGYLAYNSVISMTEYNLDYSGQSSNAVRFPDVTFCNLNPFAVNTHNVSNIHSLEYYHNRVIDRTSCDTCSEQQLKSLEELRVELLTTSGYYIHIGASKAELISHTEEELIVSCKVSMVSGMHQRRVPCEGITTVVPYQDYMYYNCYTVKLPPPTPEDLYCGLVVVLHLNNHLEMIEQQKFLTPHYIPGQMSGALMVLHEPEHLPVVIRDSISLPSGYFMSTILQFRKTNRLPSPHGDCKHGHEVNAHYQQLICYSTCVQTLVLQSCACVDYTSYNDFFALVAKAGIPACLSVKVSAERLHKNWECVKKIRLNSTAHCLSSCPIPCEELVYIHDMTYALWPTSPYHDNFYDMYISGRTYESYFTSLRNRTLRNTPKEDISSDKDLVSKNFVGVDLKIGQQLMMNYEARPQVSLSAFLSQLGGALNLWAGITVVVIIELLELFFRALADLKKSRSMEKSSSVEMNDNDDTQPMACDDGEEFKS